MPITTAPTVPAHMLPHRTPAELLVLARRGLEEAARDPARRPAVRHRAPRRPARRRGGARHPGPPAPRAGATGSPACGRCSILVAPELGEWASFFAAGAAKRAAAEAGIPRVVSAREADDLMRAAEQFVAVVEVALGLAHQPVLDGLAA